MKLERTEAALDLHVLIAIPAGTATQGTFFLFSKLLLNASRVVRS